jgi:hypothetical protein
MQNILGLECGRSPKEGCSAKALSMKRYDQRYSTSRVSVGSFDARNQRVVTAAIEVIKRNYAWALHWLCWVSRS